MITKADRAILAELARRLELPEWRTRANSAGLIMIVGNNGTVQPINGLVVLTIKPSALAASTRPLRRQLISAGIVAPHPDGDHRLTFLRMPDGHTEIEAVSRLLGLQRIGARAPVAV